MIQYHVVPRDRLGEPLDYPDALKRAKVNVGAGLGEHVVVRLEARVVPNEDLRARYEAQ